MAHAPRGAGAADVAAGARRRPVVLRGAEPGLARRRGRGAGRRRRRAGARTGSTCSAPRASRPCTRRSRPAGWPSGCSRVPAASGTSPTCTTSARCCTTSPTASGSAWRRCWSGCAGSGAATAAAASGRGGWRATPRRCRSSPSTAARACSTRSSTCRCTSTATSATRRSRSSTTAPGGCANVGGEAIAEVTAAVRAEVAAEELRLTYVALTRAQSQVVGLVGAQLERRPVRPHPAAARAGAGRGRGAAEPGQPVARRRQPRSSPPGSPPARSTSSRSDRPATPRSRRRCRPRRSCRSARFDRPIDTAWRRTSYSGLIRAEQAVVLPVTEPEEPGTVDEHQPDDEGEPLAAPGPSGRRRRVRPPRWPTCPPVRRSARSCTPCSSTPTHRRPTWRPSCSATSPSSCAGGRSTSRPTTSPRRSCRCSTRRSARSPTACG